MDVLSAASMAASMVSLTAGLLVNPKAEKWVLKLAKKWVDL
jgi:hypothetical protein